MQTALLVFLAAAAGTWVVASHFRGFSEIGLLVFQVKTVAFKFMLYLLRSFKLYAVFFLPALLSVHDGLLLIELPGVFET